MPVYLCQSGHGYNEPWRHGIQVYAAPFPINPKTGPITQSGGGRDSVVLPPASADVARWHTPQEDQQQQGSSSQQQQQQPSTPQRQQQQQQQQHHAMSHLNGLPILRVRHAEIVLVDDVCVAFGRYWLRLRWPGHKNREGFAGYIAMGLVSGDAPKSTPKGVYR